MSQSQGLLGVRAVRKALDRVSDGDDVVELSAAKLYTGVGRRQAFGLRVCGAQRLVGTGMGSAIATVGVPLREAANGKAAASPSIGGDTRRFL